MRVVNISPGLRFLLYNHCDFVCLIQQINSPGRLTKKMHFFCTANVFLATWNVHRLCVRLRRSKDAVTFWKIELFVGKFLSPYKDRWNRSQLSKLVYKASCWDCQHFYTGKTKRRLSDRKTEHFKEIKRSRAAFMLRHCWPRPDQVTSNGHNLILSTRQLACNRNTNTSLTIPIKGIIRFSPKYWTHI